MTTSGAPHKKRWMAKDITKIGLSLVNVYMKSNRSTTGPRAVDATLANSNTIVVIFESPDGGYQAFRAKIEEIPLGPDVNYGQGGRYKDE